MTRQKHDEVPRQKVKISPQEGGPSAPLYSLFPLEKIPVGISIAINMDLGKLKHNMGLSPSLVKGTELISRRIVGSNPTSPTIINRLCLVKD